LAQAMERQMRSSRRISRAITGLGAGALITMPLLGVFALGRLFGLPSVGFTVFEWLIRVLPGRLVIFGLELTLRVLEGLGFNIKNTAKTVEEALALAILFVVGCLVSSLFFSLQTSTDRLRVSREGRAAGAALGTFSLVITMIEQPPTGVANGIVVALWILGLFQLWGWGLARLYQRVELEREVAGQETARVAEEASARAAVGEAAAVFERAQPGIAGRPSAEVTRVDRRQFLVRVGGLVATVVLVGAELTEILRAESGPAVPHLVKAPIPFPNARSAVRPVPGTRPEYTAVADHYRIDIDLSPPQIDAASYKLSISGLVARPLKLTLQQIKIAYRSTDQFITLSCISNPVGGPLTGTTLWSGPPFRDVLATAAPLPSARYVHMLARDGFDEVADLAMIQGDPRIVLAHSWNGRPLPTEHGFPLRVYLPDRYGMKQPKWITDVVLVAEATQGYWVKRGWNSVAQMRTTSVVDTVATEALDMRDGRTFVPVGGIAHAGDRGISKVEVRVDNGVWQEAELRAPLSGLTWVIWRYEWPFREGVHTFAVRAYDGLGVLQDPQSQQAFPAGATGIDSKTATVLPTKL
jgi:DMSO/TMAO reductase YedYZ molybdopterin-dependent catalytic subunit